MPEVTHTEVEGTMIQIVTPERLREILDADGSDHDRPSDFSPDDEWDVGE